MRIVYVLTTLAVGGTERQVLSVAKRMAARGHAVALLVLKARGPDEFSTELEVIHLDMRKGLAGFLDGRRKGIAFLRQFRPDLIHSHNFHGNMLARLMHPAVPDARLISTIHNVYEGGRLRMLAYRLTGRYADLNTAVSEVVAERFIRLKALAKDKTVAITNAIDIAAFDPNATRRLRMRRQMNVTDEFVWLTVGRDTAAKDRPNLLQAFGRAWRTEPRMQLWIAGDHPAIHAAGKDSTVIGIPNGAADCVRRLGLRDDIPGVLDAADGFVLASAWEGMPLALAEAMAMAKPVVATDVGGVRELVGEAGLLVPPRNPDALAEAMLSVLRKSSEERAQMGRSARDRIARNFNIDHRVDQWEALYRSVLG